MTNLSFCSALIIAVMAWSGTGTSHAPNGKSLSEYGIVPEAIERVEILYFPERILTRASLTPQMLERQYQYKIEIRDFTASTQRQQFVTVLREASISPSGGSYDLRTAVLLYEKTGKRLSSLYFDRTGKNGVVNDESISINNGIYLWTKSMMRGFSD